MKAYSLDFRQKIVDLYEKGGISQRQLAKRFCVAPSFVTKILKQHRETGELSPKPRPGRPRKLQSEHLTTIETLIEAQPDLLLGELSTSLEQQFDLSVSQSTLSRTMERLGFSRKKKACTLVKKQASESNAREHNTGTK
jgi:transposase